MTSVRVDTLDAEAALAREAELLREVSEDPSKRFLWLWQALGGLPGFEG